MRRELLFLFLEVGIDDIVILSVCARISALGTRLLLIHRLSHIVGCLFKLFHLGLQRVDIVVVNRRAQLVAQLLDFFLLLIGDVRVFRSQRFIDLVDKRFRAVLQFDFFFALIVFCLVIFCLTNHPVDFFIA